MSSTPTTPTALLFGATGGIGSALARRLSAAGWRLAICARGRERLEQLAEEIGAHAEVADATDQKAVEKAFSAACEKFGRLDGVLNCTGSLLIKPAHLTTSEWSQTINANLTTAFHVLFAATSRMMRSGGGSIVLMSSAGSPGKLLPWMEDSVPCNRGFPPFNQIHTHD